MIAEVLNPASYGFNPYALPPLLVGALIFLLGLFVLTRDRLSTSSLTFHALCSLIAVWLLCFSMVFFSGNSEAALGWVILINAAIPFIPSMLFLFALSTLGRTRQNRTLIAASFFISACFSGLVFTPWTAIAGVRKHFWGYYTHYNSVIYAFLAFFCLMLMLTMILFFQEYQRCKGIKRRRLMIFLWSFGVGYLGSIDFLAALGIEVYPFGYLCVFVYIVMMGIGLARYRSVDINSSFAAEHIIKTVADALLVIDSEGIVRVSNEAANRLFGTGESLVGAPMRTRGLPFFRKENIARLLCSGKVQNTELTFRDRDKGDVVLEVSTSVAAEASGEGMAIVCIAKDITERKMAEDTLRKSEEHYRLLAQNITDLIWVMDLNLRTTFMSPSVLKFRGFSVEEASAHKAEETFVPESFQVFIKAVAEEVTRTETGTTLEPVVRTLELELLCKNGTTVWSETKLTFLRNSEGRLSELLCVARDISERRQALQALEESEDCYNDLVRQAQDAILTLDRHGYILGANPAAERVLGCLSGEIAGKHFAKTGILAPNSTAKTLQEFTLTILGWQRQPFDLQITRSDQSVRNMRAFARLIRRDREHIKVQIIFRPGTEEGHEPSALSA